MRARHDPKLEFLRTIPLFRGVPERALAQAAALMDLRSFKSDELVMLEDYHGEQFMIIVDGSAQVTRDGQHVATLEPGSFLGEAGLIAHRDRNATVRATSKLKVLSLEADGFTRLREMLPQVAERIDDEARRRRPEPTGED